MLKARRREQIEQLKFPEPRLGLPEDPRPFMGSEHFVAAATLQQHITARCLVAVTGPPGSGKSTVCLRAANSRWARQWFLQDEAGQPVHRRFWVDLEDCPPGIDAEDRIAHALGRATFAAALDRLGAGKPCLLILDNADQAFPAAGDSGGDGVLSRLVACVARGASIIMTRHSVAGLAVPCPWTDVLEVTAFASHDEARQLFDHLAPRHASDLGVDDIVAACECLPSAIGLLAKVASETDLETARIRVGRPDEHRRGLDFALAVAATALSPEDRQVWAALSLFPSGLGNGDIATVLATRGDARERASRLHQVGLVQRCPAGVRVPVNLRLVGASGGLADAAVADLWHGYVRRAQAVVATAADGAAVVRQAADSWLGRQIATLRSLAGQESMPEGTVDLARASLVAHASGPAPDALDGALVALIDAGLGSGPVPAGLAPTIGLLEEQRRFGTAVLLGNVLVAAFQRRGDVDAELAVLCQLGRAERFCSHYAAAEAYLLDAHARYEDRGDGVGQGSALFELGQADIERGRLDEGAARLDAAHALFAANGRPVGEANANLELVRIDLARGRLERAEERLADAIDRYQEAGHTLGSANACLQLGQLELARGKLDTAEGHFLVALDGYEQASDKVGFAHACLQLGQVDLAKSELRSAERRFGAALAGYDRVGDRVGRANALLQLGQIDLTRGRLETAAARLGEARTEYEQLGDRLGLAHASLQLGQVLLGRGELDEAEPQLVAAQGAYDDIGNPIGSADSRHLEAVLRQRQGRRQEAVAIFGEAARLYISLGRRASAGWCLAGAARACTGRAERNGYVADAVRYLEEAGQGDAAAGVAAEFRPAQPVPEPPAAEPWPARPAERATGADPADGADQAPTVAWPDIVDPVPDTSPGSLPQPVGSAESDAGKRPDIAPPAPSEGSPHPAPADAPAPDAMVRAKLNWPEATAPGAPPDASLGPTNLVWPVSMAPGAVPEVVVEVDPPSDPDWDEPPRRSRFRLGRKGPRGR